MAGNRRIAALQWLQVSGALTAPQLAEALAVSVSTVRRDISALELMGIPVRPADGGTGYRVPAGYRAQLAHARRLASMLQLLSAHDRMTGSQVAREMGTSLQTVRRDAAALSSAGLPLHSRIGTLGGYWLPDDLRARLEAFSTADTQLLVLAGLPADAPGAGMLVVSYTYAVHGDLPALLLEELRRARDLRTRLADVSRQHSRTVRAIWASSPDVAAARAEFDSAHEMARKLGATARRSRRRGQAQRARDEAPQQVRQAAERRSAARRELRAAQRRAYPGLRPQFAAALDAYRASIPEICRDAAAAGLGWATVNAVSRPYRTALPGRGRPAWDDANAPSWDGTETVTVQLQRLSGQPPRSPTLLASGDGRYSSQAVLQPWMPPAEWQALSRAERHRRQAGTLRIRIGTGQRASMVTVPVVVHRMLPAGADIAHITVARELVGTRYRSRVNVAVRVPEPGPRDQGSRVAVLARCRELPDGAIRTALIMGAEPPPQRILNSGVVRQHAGWAEVVIPASWRAARQQTAALRGRRARGLAKIRAYLAAWSQEREGFGSILGLGDSPGAGVPAAVLARAAERLRESPPAGCAEVAARLEAWRRADRWLADRAANERDQLRARRDDAWGTVAAWVTSAARLVVMDEPARRSPPASGDAPEDSPEHEAERAARMEAAPYLLRRRMAATARQRGVRIELIPLPAAPAPAGPGPDGGAGDPDAAAAAWLIAAGAAGR